MPNYWLIAGLIGVTGSIFGYLIFPYALKFGIKSQTNLAKNGLIFPKWSKPPFLTNSTMYLYEVENPKQAMKGAKIRVKRKGPYVFKVANNKERPEFSDNEERVTLYATRKFFYSPELSADIDERFYMLNPVVPGTQAFVKQIVMDKLPFKRLAEPIVYQTVTVVLDSHNERLFEKKSPREILFGYKIQVLENVFELSERLGLRKLLPEGPPDNILGIAFFQNVTEDKFTMFTGVGNNVDRLGDVISWRGQHKMSTWKSDRCNKIVGDNGEIHKPMLERNKSIPVFIAQACRSLTLDPVGKTAIVGGIEVEEYELTRKMFQGIKTNPDNVCYCPDKTALDCLYDGIAPMGPCLFNAPVHVSRTSFLKTDPRLKKLVEFNKDDSPAGLDKVALYIEPLTAATLKADIALMGSIKVVRQPYMRDQENIRNISYVPFITLHELIELPPEITWQLKALIMFVNNHGYLFSLGGLAGGALTIFGMTKQKKEKPITDNNKDSTTADNNDDGSMIKDTTEKPAIPEANEDKLDKVSRVVDGDHDTFTDAKASMSHSDSAIDVASTKESLKSAVQSSIHSAEVDHDGTNNDDTTVSPTEDNAADIVQHK